MTTRTVSRSVVFAKPFSLPGVRALQPAGVYVVETDEESIDSASFIAYRRTSTRIQLAKDANRPGFEITVTVDPADLEAALT